MKSGLSNNYSREYLLTEDINIYRNMLRKHRASTPEYRQIADYLETLKELKKENRKNFCKSSSYYKKRLPSYNSVPKKSKIQHVLDELYKERKQIQIQIFNQEIEIKKIDKKIEEVKASKKRK